MTEHEYKERFKLTDSEWHYLFHCDGFKEFKDDYSLIEAIVTFGKNAETQNPYYKFFEVLLWVKDNDYVHYTDVLTLDRYYKMHMMDYLLSPKGEYYTGLKASSSEELAEKIGIENKDFNFDYFRQLIVNTI